MRNILFATAVATALLAAPALACGDVSGCTAGFQGMGNLASLRWNIWTGQVFVGTGYATAHDYQHEPTLGPNGWHMPIDNLPLDPNGTFTGWDYD